MKTFDQIMAGLLILSALLLLAANGGLHVLLNQESDRPYQVEVNRLAVEIAEKGYDQVELAGYSCVKNVEVLPETMAAAEKAHFFSGGNLDYVVRYWEGAFYRFDYEACRPPRSAGISLLFNLGLGGMAVLTLAVLLFVRANIVKPFHQVKDMPYALAKGNLTIGLLEFKSRFFGKFVWGLNLLRESLEQNKRRELSLQKENKTLILSISHDIKTPLSAIKLYAQALSKNLYTTEEKRRDTALRIERQADEIERFVRTIIQASEDDFLNLQTENGGFYLEQLIREITAYYGEKLPLIGTAFLVGSYDNCLLSGDLNRTVEALQNIIENAVKYGDGESIRIASQREEDCVLVTVANTGCTLPQGETIHVFDSFWRGSNAREKDGNGLGLYICRQLMRKMGGDAYAERANSEMRVTIVLRML